MGFLESHKGVGKVLRIEISVESWLGEVPQIPYEHHKLGKKDQLPTLILCFTVCD